MKEMKILFRISFANAERNENSLQNCFCERMNSEDYYLSLVGGGGFEPPKSMTTDLQSVPFGHSGILPYSVVFSVWWAFRDSNPRPTGYEPVALTN